MFPYAPSMQPLDYTRGSLVCYNAPHGAFAAEDQEIMNELPLILFGVGGVGSALLRQILENRSFHADQYGLHLRVLALCDRDGAVVEPYDGLNDATLTDLLAYKKAGNRLRAHVLGGAAGDLTDIIDIVGLPKTVVVDCTATDQTVSALLFALEQGYKIALANKKPLTTDQEVYDRLTRAGATEKEGGKRSLSRSRWETTVGAGLPVIATLNRLMSSGDQIQGIAGAFSGTLGYVMTGLQEGRLFSEIVLDAFKQGYTEPDPRDDLGGMDVARKALILARGLGWSLNMADVTVVSLYPAAMDSLSVDEFLAALPALDAGFTQQVAAAAAQGHVLRYAATVEGGQCRVGPTAVPLSSPLGRLNGTDNLAEFTSRWYTPNPLVIQGRGAGVDATAAGVLSDVIELAYSK